MTDCIFCDILAGDAPSSPLYQDELCYAFLDIRPVNPGHTLIIPRSHAASLMDLDPDHGAQLFRVGQKIAHGLRSSGLRCEGVNLFLADGEVAGQEVFHLHLHLFPRFAADGFGFRFGPEYGQRPERGELDRTAKAISSYLR